MPTYDYECDGCGHCWELFQKITDDKITKCPECKRPKARRLFGTGAAIVFKGSGFYQTDYRSESYKKGEKAASDSSESKAESKSESKSETKSGDTAKSERKERKSDRISSDPKPLKKPDSKG